MGYDKLQSSAKHLVAEEKQINALLTMTALVGTHAIMISKTIILNLIVLQLFLWYCDRTTDLIVHQAARNQRLKPVVKCFWWAVLKTITTWIVRRLREAGRGGWYGEEDKEENRTKQENHQAAETFSGTQILPIFFLSFFFFLSLQMLNWSDYKALVCFVLLQWKSEN